MPRLLVPKRSMSRRRMSTTSSAVAASIFLPTTPEQLAPHPGYAAFAVFTKRLCSGTLAPDDARHLFDGLLQGNDPRPRHGLPPSAACGDGTALAVELFGLMPQGDRGHGPRRTPTRPSSTAAAAARTARDSRSPSLATSSRPAWAWGWMGPSARASSRPYAFMVTWGQRRLLTCFTSGCRSWAARHALFPTRLCSRACATRGGASKRSSCFVPWAGEGGACSPNVVS